MKEPSGFDWQTSDKYNQVMERNYTNDLQNGRNTGIMLHGRCSDDMLLYQVGMFREANSSGDDLGNAKAGEYNFAARLAARPIVEDDGTTWLHIGGSASYRDYALQPGLETLLAEGSGNEKGECKLEYAWSCGKTGMRLYLRCRFAQLFRVRSYYPKRRNRRVLSGKYLA